MVNETAYLGLSQPDYDEVADISVLNSNSDTIDTAICQLANLQLVTDKDGMSIEDQSLYLLSSLTYRDATANVPENLFQLGYQYYNDLVTLLPMAYDDGDINVPQNLYQLGYQYYNSLIAVAELDVDALADVADYWGAGGQNHGYLVKDVADGLWAYVSDLTTLAEYADGLSDFGRMLNQEIVKVGYNSQFTAELVKEDQWSDIYSLTITPTDITAFDHVANLDDSGIMILGNPDSSDPRYMQLSPSGLFLHNNDGEDNVEIAGETGPDRGGFVKIYGYQSMSDVTVTGHDLYTSNEHWGDAEIAHVGASNSLNETIEGIFQRINALDHLDD